MKKILDKIADFLANISTVFFIVIFLINMLEIFSRTFFNHSFLWVSDVTVICVVWMIFLSMAVAVYHKEHLVMDFIVNKMPKEIQRGLGIALNIISIIFFLMLFQTGIQTAATKKALLFPSIMVSQIWSYSAMPVFAILSAIFMIPRLISSLKNN
ncbi:TRAP transporter small permease [Thermosediminibacter litoriperuensis]|uniref:TRAP-type C4-dicarboxylate transport system permease small subunit n=1 Tax=Thermosediminibacter litoriperuensis TaxID=291989 RepID=A0A5S5ANJ8_9FIRM|nr:TRAP transporter small permease [Thermosediminibacter litoriperuensis]TYP53236.1 TRAP-type C4-dicarboxylate transport system permease small subunit [Thermosediminibacter litoriperuensis]